MSAANRRIIAREVLSLALYLALALWWSWPLAARFGTHIGGGHGPMAIGDNLQFAWNFDHVGRAWASGQSAFESRELFFPHPASLALHTMQWHHASLAALARWVAPQTSLPVLCNTLLLGTLIFNAYATRLLCRHILRRAKLRSEASAWLIGAGAALGPIAQARVEGHWNLLAWGYLPLCMLALMRLDESIASESKSRWSRVGWIIGAGVALALAGWCDVQFVLMGALWALAFGLFSWRTVVPARRWSRAVCWVAALGVGAVLLAPLVLVMLRASTKAAMMPIAPEWALDVANLLSPSPWHPILGKWAFGDIRLDGIEWVASPGLIILLLGVWGWRTSPQAARPWAWCALFLWLLACGPRLQIAHRPVPPVFFSTSAASGAPSSTSPGTSASTWGRRARREGWPHAAKMPFWWLRSAVGPLKSFRAPVRLSIAALVCWSVCAALGMASVAHERRPFKYLMPVAGALILFECWRVPLPAFEARPPRWALAIRDAPPSQDGAEGVVPLPIAFNDWRASWAMWAQTIHRRPLWNAYLSRAPRLPRDAVRSTPLWRVLSTWAQVGTPEERLGLREPLPSPAQAARDLKVWRRNGARFLIWQRQSARGEDEARVREMLARTRSTRILIEEPDATVWEIAPSSTSGGSN